MLPVGKDGMAVKFKEVDVGVAPDVVGVRDGKEMLVVGVTMFWVVVVEAVG